MTVQLRSRIPGLIRRLIPGPRAEEDMAREMRLHLDLLAREYEDTGLPPEEARQAARRRFGNLASLRERGREARARGLLGDLVRDLGYARRSFRRSPGLSAVIVLTLALVVGTNTAIFSLVDALMLRKLPVREPDQLVELLSVYPGDPRVNSFAWDAYAHFRQENSVFSGLTGSLQFNLEAGPVMSSGRVGEYVAGDFFSVLGLQPALGRLIRREDDQPGSEAVAVVSWSWWQREFGLDPSILGSQVLVGDRPARIVGIAPRGFVGLQPGSRTELWAPLSLGPEDPSLSLLGRLRPGASIEDAREEMRVLDQWRVENWARESADPQVRNVRIDVESAAAGFSRLRDQYAGSLIGLQIAAGFLLALASANVAGLLLTRAMSRRHEIAVRISLGAGRMRLIRQTLTEAALLAAAGGLAGSVLAWVGADLLVGLLASGRLPVAIEVTLDSRVLAFTVAISLGAAILSGLMPTWMASGSDPGRSLWGRGASAGSRPGWNLSRALVVLQIALVCVLLSLTGVFVSHLGSLRDLSGFDADSVLIVRLGPERGQRPRLAGPYGVLLDELESLPGVEAVSLAGITPAQGAGASRRIAVDGIEEDPADRRYLALNWIGPGYFRVLGTRLLAGRDFATVEPVGRQVAIVNEAMASDYFGNDDAVGRVFRFEDDDTPYEIVGVVGDASYYELGEPIWRTVYLNSFQQPEMLSNQVVVRTAGPPAAMAQAVRARIREVVPDIPVTAVTTLRSQVDQTIVSERLLVWLAGVFGVVGTFLTIAGVYGLMGTRVARRTEEIGLRLALGAQPAAMIRMVLRDTVVLLSAGLLAGVPLSFWARQIVEARVGDLLAGSALSVGAASLTIVLTALLASSFPAWRAARTDPLIALRLE